MSREGAVREAFAAQARHCERLGSPLTARVCALLAERLDRTTAIGRRVLDWPGRPEAGADALPLRLAGGLHALVRRGGMPALAALYPPAPLPAADALWAALAPALDDPALDPWLDGPPQTNEVARAAVLMAGLHVIAAETRGSLVLSELGASAGLNLVLDRYAYDLGGRRLGPPDAVVRLAPAWEGPPPPEAALRIVARRGVDVAPLDVTSAHDRERLAAYVWPDQTERLARIEAAMTVAATDPPILDGADAAEWLEARLHTDHSGSTHVVMHSIAFQYFPEAARRRIAEGIGEAGARNGARLAWLRFEAEPEGMPSLRLALWPGGRERLLARADPHVRGVRWLA